MADARNLDSILAQIVQDVQKEIQVNLPRKVGIIAKNHFTENFREGGFVDGGLHKWQTTKRQQRGGSGADSKYLPLNSRRDHLMRSIDMEVAPGQVTIKNEVEYANIHNEGGDTHPRVTPKMRKFAWAKFYSLSNQGKKPSPDADSWKALALTKKQILSIHIPQRKFIGDSKELTDKIEKLILQTINKITNGINSL